MYTVSNGALCTATCYVHKCTQDVLETVVLNVREVSIHSAHCHRIKDIRVVVNNACIPGSCPWCQLSTDMGGYTLIMRRNDLCVCVWGGGSHKKHN